MRERLYHQFFFFFFIKILHFSCDQIIIMKKSTVKLHKNPYNQALKILIFRAIKSLHFALKSEISKKLLAQKLQKKT